MIYEVTDRAPARLGKKGDRKEMTRSQAALHVARGEMVPVAEVDMKAPAVGHAGRRTRKGRA